MKNYVKNGKMYEKLGKMHEKLCQHRKNVLMARNFNAMK